MKSHYILAINPGSTSTKIAIYKDEEQIAVESLAHSLEEIKKYETIYDQKDMRTQMIMEWLEKQSIRKEELSAIVGRGGLLRPMPGGTYKVTAPMVEDLRIGYQDQHASNLGGIIARSIADELGIEAYIVDPVAVDEMDDVARISGLPQIPRKSLVHVLNIKAVTRRVCKKLNKDFYKSTFVVAHLGGGISVSPLKNGRILDVNNANQDGPFSPERCGGVPVGSLVEMAFSGKYTEAELKKMRIGHGGFVGYLGTNDGRKVQEMIDNGDEKAKLILKAMAHQLSKEIGAMATVVCGKVDAIILTGGLAYNKNLTTWIEESTKFIAPVEIVPGEDEMLALAQGALRIVRGEEKAKIYEDEVDING